MTFACCSPVGSNAASATHTIQNVGGAVDAYIVGTGPNPFQLRTFESSDASVSIQQNAQTIDFTVIPTALASAQNVGGFNEVYVDGTGPNPFSFRTLQSSDGSISITQNANDLDLIVPPTAQEVFQSDGVSTLSTTSTTYQTWHTTAAIPEISNTEIWKINWCIAVCHPANVFSVNTQVRILLETSPGVFAQLDEWQVAWPITITSGTSCPAHRTIRLVASMSSPRFRFQVRMNAAQASATFVETPRVGGVRIS